MDHSAVFLKNGKGPFDLVGGMGIDHIVHSWDRVAYKSHHITTTYICQPTFVMTKDILPPSEPVTGPRKWILTERAKQASNSWPTKKPRTSGTLHMAGTSKSTSTHRKTVSIEDIEDEEDLPSWSPPPHNPNHILEGPDDDEEDIVELPRKKSKTSTRRKTVIKDIEDEEDLYQSPPLHNPNHILKGPDDDEDAAEVIEVHSDVPENPAESAEAELSKSYLNVKFLYILTFACRAALQKMDLSYLRLLSPDTSHWIRGQPSSSCFRVCCKTLQR
jgi:hypothetical protein